MAIVREEIDYGEFPLTLTVLQRRHEIGERIENWRFIDIEWDGFERVTPKELREIGKWMIEQGARIGKEYRCNGAKK